MESQNGRSAPWGMAARHPSERSVTKSALDRGPFGTRKGAWLRRRSISVRLTPARTQGERSRPRCADLFPRKNAPFVPANRARKKPGWIPDPGSDVGADGFRTAHHASESLLRTGITPSPAQTLGGDRSQDAAESSIPEALPR